MKRAGKIPLARDAGTVFRIFSRTFEVNKSSLLYAGLFALVLRVRNPPVGITAFNCFFMKISNTRLAVKQTYYLPNARTNYGMFNIRFKGPKVWNDLDENIKGFSLPVFKNKLKQSFLESY